MSLVSSAPTRRRFVASVAASLGLTLATAFSYAHADPAAGLPSTKQHATAEVDSIRPFPKVHVPQAAIDELRRRIAATQWPEKETVADSSQGVPLATMQNLARYWATDYDWRKAEAKLNALPQFVTTIDGVDIHFIHVRSKNSNALPLIINHGWPGSVLEQIKLIGPLTDPVAYGGKAEDAFDVVIPSMPGYGFSGKPTTTGWGPEHMARAWAELMRRLGYQHYVAQGGDWGAFVVDQMGLQAPTTTVSQIQPDIPATRTARKLAGDGAGDEHSQRRNRVRHVSLDSLGCLEECNLRVGKTLLVERGFFWQS